MSPEKPRFNPPESLPIHPVPDTPEFEAAAEKLKAEIAEKKKRRDQQAELGNARIYDPEEAAKRLAEIKKMMEEKARGKK